MRSYKSILFAFLGLSMVAIALAQSKNIDTATPTPPKAPSAVTATTQAQTVVHEHVSTQELAVLKSQLEQFKTFQDSLLTTVWGALGVVLAMSIVLIGGSWYTNNHAYARDKAALRKELLTVIEGRLVDHSQVTNDRITAVQDQTATQFGDQKAETNRAIAVALNEAKTKALETSISLTKTTWEHYQQNQQEILTLKSEFYGDKGWLENALQIASYALRTALSRGDEFWIDHAMKRTGDALSALEGRSDAPTSHRTRTLEIVLEVFTKGAEKVPEGLREAYEALRTRVLVLAGPGAAGRELETLTAPPPFPSSTSPT